MEPDMARQYSPQERLTQLKTTEALFDAGLYTSALLMTGIHLSTVQSDEAWFLSRAYSRYARCLSRLQEHQRSIEYYRRSQVFSDSPVPSDISLSDSLLEHDGSTTTAEADTNGSGLPDNDHSTGVLAMSEANMENAMKVKNRHAREEIQKKARQTLSKWGSRFNKNAAGGRTSLSTSGPEKKTPMPTVPAVVPQSTLMKKRLASHMETDGLNSESTPVSDMMGSQGRHARGESASETVAREYKQLSQDDIDIDYAQSCINAKHYSKAKDVIDKIPESSRSVRVYLLLIQLSRHKVKNVLPEKACWECIAEMQPLAIEAYVHLLRSQTHLPTLLNMIPSDSLEKRWMTIYLLGTDNFLRMKHAAALSEFCKLNEKYPDNIDLKLRMALCLKRLGKAVRASFVYSQVRKLDSCVLKDMYHYGVCLRQLSSAAYLNKLASELLRCNDRHADTWCVQALYWDMKKNKEKALQMIARALQINPEHCGALQLRGQVYMDTSPTEALKAFREANRIERDIVTLEGLVNAYILLGRQLEAVGIAKEALSLMPDNPQAMALYGMATYHAGEQGTDIATELLLKALDKDPACVQAAICLVMIYENQERYNDALELLDQQIDYQPPDTVYVRKAEIYTTMEDWEQALSSYQKALSANLNNTRAKEGLAHVEKILSGGDEEDDEEAEETDNNDDRENEDIDTDPDQHQLNDHMGGNLDEDDVLTGEEDQGEEYEDDYSYRQQEQHHQPHHSTHQHVHQAPQPQQLEESSLYQSRGFGQTRHQQTPVMTRLIRAGVAFEQGPPPLQHPRLNQNQPQQQFLSQLQQQPHQQQHRSAGSNSVPGFGMRYPHTPSRPPVGSGASSRTPLPLPTSRLFTSQRERDYEEAADGGEDMEG